MPWGSSGNSSNVPDFGQCGGVGDSCPLTDQSACTDTQYLPCAFDTSQCIRLSKFYWQCRPISAPSLTNTTGGPALDYTQCGGIGDSCPLADKMQCADRAYLACQIKTSKCTRINRYYWHCLPQASPPVQGPHPVALAAQVEAPQQSSVSLQPATEPARRGISSHVPEFFICGGMGDACPLSNRELCVDAQYVVCAPGNSCVRQSKWYWQCLPHVSPAPAPHSSGRRLQAGAFAAQTPAASRLGQMPDPQPSIVPAPSGSRAPDYGQCGGAGSSCPLANKAQCIDLQYLDCASGTFQCVRQNQWYWQCTPRPTSQPGVPVPPAYGPVRAQPPTQLVQAGSSVPDYFQCGGAGETCPLANRQQCTDAQYLNCTSESFSCMRQSTWYWQVLYSNNPLC